MATWVDLGDLYTKKAGDTVSGNIIMSNNNLSVVNGDNTYNVGTEIKSLWDSVSQLDDKLGEVMIRSGSWVGKLGSNVYWDWMPYSTMYSLFGNPSGGTGCFSFVINNGETGAAGTTSFAAQFDNSREYVRIANTSGGILPTVTIRLNWVCIYNPSAINSF